MVHVPALVSHGSLGRFSNSCLMPLQRGYPLFGVPVLDVPPL